FGTQDGLNRYDGYNFKVFKNNPEDSATLSDNFIFSIYEDRSGILYVETQSSEFHKYNPAAESFSVVIKDSIDLSGASFNTVGAIFEELSGVIWTGGLSRSIGLTKEDKKTGRITHFKHNPSDPSSLSDDKVYSILRDRNGNLWIGTFNGLDRLDEKTGKFYHYRNDPSDPNSIADNWIWPLYEDTKGNLWIGTVKGGLCKFDPRTKSFYNYKNNPSEPASINDNYIFSIYQDRSGVIWIGTNTGGINYFHPSSQVFEHYLSETGEKNSLADNDILSLFADNAGNYWIGTRNGGLSKFNYSAKRFTNYSANSSNQNSISTNSIQVIYQDRSGILWLGNFNGGLDALDPKTGKFKHYKNNPLDSNSISDNRIVSVIEDKEGFIWIGTYGGGLNKLDKKTGTIIRYQFDEKDNSSISSNPAWSIIEDRTGKLWIGTFGGGINIFNKASQTFTHLKSNPSDSASLNDDNVIRIFEDSKGGIWAGTTKGLARYVKKNNTFKNYREKDGLANDFVYGILEDGKGNLWLSTNNGISKFDPQKEIFKNYHYNDGLQGNEYNQNAFAEDFKTGRLLFGGINGFNIFHPDSITGNKYLPPLVFTDFLRYNTDDEEGKPIIEKGISYRENIVLTYKDNIITIVFSALNFNNSSKNQYRYKLEGFNENWIQLGVNHSVTFTNLSQGEYNLKVIGSNNDGLWNEKGANLFIEVLPPWWRTKIAYIFYGITFISILYGLRRFELNRREQKARIRETELRMKATEAEKRAIEAENERKTKELEEARQLQLSMLPKELPKLPNLKIAAFMRTATEVGGDYYDFIVSNGVLNIAFGDATGHGLQAGTMVTLMKGFFTSDAARLELPEFMNHCNNMIKEIKLGRILMSFCFMRIENNKLTVASAGMPPVYYYSSEAHCTEEIILQGMPLGAMRNSNYKTASIQMKSGDTILLLSDGLPEQMNRNKEVFDYSRVKECFSKFAEEGPDDIINNIIKYGDEWMDGAVQTDDMSFIILKAI
ncbi:MAG: two-component regulator propeller domain-containing protein, partial [Ignavibacteria bacterium]